MARRNEVEELELGPVSRAVGDVAEVDVVFTDPAGGVWRVPAFASQGLWRVRYASARPGRHRFEVVGAPHLRESGEVHVTADAAPDPLSEHGPLRVAEDRRHFEHVDGTPFLWLADTWWDAFVDRISDTQFYDLACRRATQGFSVVQVVAGLYPEMDPFAPEGTNAAGWAWQSDFVAINDAWFDAADRRIHALVQCGLVPCVVGAWGYYIQAMGVRRMQTHWRALLARWGAYPVVWCLAGELSMPTAQQTYQAAMRLSDGRLSGGEAVRLVGRTIAAVAGRVRRSGRAGFPDTATIVQQLGLSRVVDAQVTDWAEVARCVRELEPFGRPVSAHPAANWPIDNLDIDNALLDFWMLQNGHSATESPANSVSQLVDVLTRDAARPALVAEVCYEGILGSGWHEVQRFLFYSHLLSGAAGHSYGAQGLWGYVTSDYLGGLAGRWNDLAWEEAAELPGATHLGIGRRFLDGLPWTRFTPHQEWVEPHANRHDRIQPYAAGIPDEVRLVYFPASGLVRHSLGYHRVKLRHLDGKHWHARYVNPRTGERHPPFTISPDVRGSATLTGGIPGPLPSKEDWLLLLWSTAFEEKADTELTDAAVGGPADIPG